MGALIGGIITEAATLITAYYVLDQQQQAFNQQQITEQKNIAQAHYIDICAVEELFNHSLNTTNSNDYYTVNFFIIIPIAAYIMYLIRIFQNLMPKHQTIYTIFIVMS